MKSINANIEEELYNFKRHSGMTWSGIIRRGVESIAKAHTIAELQMTLKEREDKIESLVKIIERIK